MLNLKIQKPWIAVAADDTNPQTIKIARFWLRIRAFRWAKKNGGHYFNLRDRWRS